MLDSVSAAGATGCRAIISQNLLNAIDNDDPAGAIRLARGASLHPRLWATKLDNFPLTGKSWNVALGNGHPETPLSITAYDVTKRNNARLRSLSGKARRCWPVEWPWQGRQIVTL